MAKPGSTYSGTGYPDAIMYDVPFDASPKPGMEIGYLADEWKKIFEEFPDRFVIGSDINTGRFDSYDRVIKTFRTVVLKVLRKDVAEKIAFKNAWKLMSGTDWKD